MAGSPHAGTVQPEQPFPERSFEEGDLVYGVEKGPYLQGKGRAHYIDSIFKSKLPCRIDNYRVLGNEKKAKLPEGLSQEEEKRLLDTLDDHPKYRNAVGQDDSNSALRRKSKGGLHWATLVEQKHVHFVLDSLDIHAVINKSYSGKENADNPKGPSSNSSANSEKNRSITGSELRWIYRNRDNHQVKQHIHFWLDGEHCSAPWEKSVTDQPISATNNETTPKKGRMLPEPISWDAYKPKSSS
jgi:hypothetical protein